MNPEQFNREKRYQAAMSVARRMLSAGALTPGDMIVIDTKLKEKYKPLFGSLSLDIYRVQS
ncbi:MAG: hypothetical protein FWF08_00530 [Oscillospiraceae bacterium]|nr:hypothetical protein [Oscillospiraceae bacterium]